MNKTRAKYLLERYYSNSLTTDERTEFVLLLHDPKFEQFRSDWLDELWPLREEKWQTPPNEQPILKNLIKTFKLANRRRGYLKYGSVAAAILLSFVALLLTNNKFSSYFPSGNNNATTLSTEQVTLLLGDGKAIPLDTLQSTIILDKELIYADGKPVLDSSSFIDQMVTLTVPAKKTYAVQLSDGTRVQLNAQTSITFPRYFPSKERRVILEGEAYFDVQKDNSRPFFVTTMSASKPLSIEVTGTKFNLNAYSNDPINSVSLVEGHVIVNQQQLSANKAFYINKEGSLIGEFNVSNTLAWINHEFRFENESLYGILRKMEQWYGVRFKIETMNEKVRIGGAISKGKDLETILDLLETYCEVKFSTTDSGIEVKKK